MIYFRTLNSIYQIDQDNMTWERYRSWRSGDLFGVNKGPLLKIPSIEIGFSTMLVESPEGELETVYTSKVLDVWESDNYTFGTS